MLYHWGTLSDGGPLALDRHDELAAYLLTPGFSQAYHQQALGVSNATLWKYMRWAREMGRQNADIHCQVEANVGSITGEDGLLMAQRRGPSQLPFWSRLAILEMLETHGDVAKIAALFRCCARTVNNVRAGVCTGYNPVTGVRQLSDSQIRPPMSRD